MVKWLLMAGIIPVSLSPAFATPTPQQLVEVIDVSGLSLSPDGQNLVFREEAPSIEENRVRLRWLIMNTMGKGDPIRIGDGGIPILNDSGTIVAERPVWSPDSRWIFFRAAVGGQVQVWKAARDGSSRQQVTFDDADVEGFQLIGDGTTLIYVHGPSREEVRAAEMREYERGIEFDRSIDPGQAVFRGGNVNGRPASQRLYGDWFDRRGLLDGAPRRHESIDLTSGEKRLATTDEFREYVERAGSQSFADLTSTTQKTDPKSGLVARLEQSGLVTKVTVTDPGGKIPPRICPSSICGSNYVASFAWKGGGQKLIVTILDQAKASTVFEWDVRTNRSRTLLGVDGILAGDVQPATACAMASERMFCVTSTAGTPPQLEQVDLKRGTRTVMHAPNASIGRSVVERLDWTDSKGRHFIGRFFPADGPMPSTGFPLFVNYYGCTGYLRGGVGNEYPFAALAANGISALCINRVSASADSHQYDAVADYHIALEGVRSAIDLLATRHIVDPKRVGMGGLSFGAEATAWVATHSNLLAAVSLSSGLIEPTYYWFNIARNPEMQKNLLKWWGLGEPEKTPGRWKVVSTALNVGSFSAPVLFQVPEQEFRYNLELHGRLVSDKRCSTMFIYPDEGHTKIQPQHKLAVYQRNIRWFGYWLGHSGVHSNDHGNPAHLCEQARSAIK
jgi:hypothetical protein